MNLQQYQEAVQRTCATTTREETLKMALIGLADELGEVAGPLKKHLFHGHELGVDQIAHIQDELGDITWYLGVLCNALDIRLDDVLEGNVKKLQRRYPEGFSSERSINRDEQLAIAALQEMPGSEHVSSPEDIETYDVSVVDGAIRFKRLDR